MQNWKKIRDKKLIPDVFVKRAKIFDLIREWFRQEGFLEVETPLMVRHPGMEPHLNLFSSEFVSDDEKSLEKRYLHTSPEYSMKKLLASGFEKIFQITKVFRNGEFGGMHNPEFTMLEWYRSYSDYEEIMEDCEGMIRYVVEGLGLDDNGQNSPSERMLIWAGKALRPNGCSSGRAKLQGPNIQCEWTKLSVKEAFQRYAQIDLDQLRNLEDFRKVVEQKKYSLNTEYSWDDLFFLIFLNEVESHLGKESPVFLYDYPASQAALAKKKDSDSFWAERFELYIDGVELCNAFSELTDPVEQRQRLEDERSLRLELGKEIYDIDECFLEALETMPTSGGNALGIDRLVMVLLGKKSLKDVMFFPWEDV